MLKVGWPICFSRLFNYPISSPFLLYIFIIWWGGNINFDLQPPSTFLVSCLFGFVFVSIFFSTLGCFFSLFFSLLVLFLTKMIMAKEDQPSCWSITNRGETQPTIVWGLSHWHQSRMCPTQVPTGHPMRLVLSRWSYLMSTWHEN